MSRAWRATVAVLAGTLVGGCELTETTVADGEPVVVVQAVLRTDDATLGIVVLEWSWTGRSGGTQTPACKASQRIPQCSPADPISGATVVLTDRELTARRCDSVLVLSEQDPTNHPGVYGGFSEFCNFRPGDHVALSVTLPGHIVTGALVMPGIDSAVVNPGDVHTDFSIRGILLNRDRDTLRVHAWAHPGRAMQLEARPEDNLNERAFLLVTDSLGIAVPGNFVLPSDTNAGASVFRPGHSYELALDVTDTNYYDFARSASDPFTGRGFINHLSGGVGVFGAIMRVRYIIRVTSNVDDAREGVWQVQGTVGGVDVDVKWEGYLDGRGDTVAIGAFVSGTWLDGTLNTSVDGTFRGSDLVADISFVSGPDSALVRKRQHLAGHFVPNGPFPIEVRDDNGVLLGTLVAQRQ